MEKLFLLQPVPADAPIVRDLRKMSDIDREELCKFFQIAYLNAYKARRFMDFTDWVEWSELNGIKFNVTAYKTHTQCTEFVNFISKTFLRRM